MISVELLLVALVKRHSHDFKFYASATDVCKEFFVLEFLFHTEHTDRITKGGTMCSTGADTHLFIADVDVTVLSYDAFANNLCTKADVLRGVVFKGGFADEIILCHFDCKAQQNDYSL